MQVFKFHNVSVCHQAALMLQSAMRGHASRRDRMRKMQRYQSDDTETITESELESATETIQSSLRGHAQRKEMIRKR